MIAETSEEIHIGKDFPDEYVGSQDTVGLKGTLAKAKANAAQGIAQMIQDLHCRCMMRQEMLKDIIYLQYAY